MSFSCDARVLSDVVAISHRTVRLQIEGEVDLASSQRLKTALEREVSAGNDVMLDLSGVQFMDCSGLDAILWAASQARCNGLQLKRTSPLAAQVRRLLEMADVQDALPVVFDNAE